MDTLIPFKLKFEIVTVLAIVFVGLAFILFIFTLLLKIRKNQKSIRDSRFKQRAEEVLNELLARYDEPEDHAKKTARRKLIRLTNRTWKRVLITDLLIHYTTNLTGGVEKFVTKLYYGLHLEQLNMQELKKGSVTQKVRAMRCLSKMRYQPAWTGIITYINDERKLLRVEATLALMSLTKNPLFFLDSLEKRMTQWQKLNVYKQLKETPKEEIPKFERWFRSRNKSVVLFAVEMAGKFNQSASRKAVSRLLLIDDVDVQCQAIRTLVELEAYEFANVFAKFLKITPSERLALELLRAIGEVSMDPAHIEILDDYLVHPRHNIRFQASRAILKIENGEERFKMFAAKYPDHLGTIARHLSNPLLN